MGKTSKIKEHLSLKEIDKRIKETKGFWKLQRWYAIGYCMVEPETTEKIGKKVGLKKVTVQKLFSQYNKHGEKAVNTKGKGGRKYGYMTLEQEKVFLKECEQKSLKGKYTTTADIKRAFEEKIGKKVANSTFYNLLHRHDWRKLTARSHHPKKDEKKQEKFKKTSNENKRSSKEEKTG